MNESIQKQYAHFIEEAQTEEAVTFLEQRIIKNYQEVPTDLKHTIEFRKLIILNDTLQAQIKDGGNNEALLKQIDQVHFQITQLKLS